MFLLYLNDIINTVRYSKIKLFADVTMIRVDGNNIFEMAEYLHNDLANIYEYLQLMSVFENINKCKAMII